MLAWLADKILTVPFVGAILKPVINGLLTAQKQKLDAIGSHEARVTELAQRQLELDQREAEVNAQVVIAEQGHWVTRSIRPLLGLAAAVLTWKILVWDLALGQWTDGSTDKLSDQAFWLLTTIVIAYMGGRSAEKIADKIAGVFKRGA
jgi:hypothetical protein